MARWKSCSVVGVGMGDGGRTGISTVVLWRKKVRLHKDKGRGREKKEYRLDAS